MCHLDGVNSALIEGEGDGRYMLGRIPVPYGVHAVPKGDVLDVKLVDCRIKHGQAAMGASLRTAIFSAVRRAAEVMISRLPAKAGR